MVTASSGPPPMVWLQRPTEVPAAPPPPALPPKS
jgi:hypothetical protein